jgi:hypothetical protein
MLIKFIYLTDFMEQMIMILSSLLFILQKNISGSSVFQATQSLENTSTISPAHLSVFC